MRPLSVLVACECSGRVREAFRKLGHNAWSCDIEPAEDGSPWHRQIDAIEFAYNKANEWDLLIAHPPCTRLTNAASRWLHKPPKGKTLDEIWEGLEAGAAFYRALRDAPIPFRAIENPVMHCHAIARINPGKRQVVQPWWFGEPAFKATGFELIGLPPLRPTNKLTPPKSGTDEHKAWSWIHRMAPGPNRAKDRSRTFRGIADAIADQWGAAAQMEIAA